MTEFDSQVGVRRSDGEVLESLHQAVCGQLLGHSLVPLSRLRLCHLHEEGSSEAAGTEKEQEAEGGAVGGATEAQLTCGENVECGQGHGFCWWVAF